MTTTKLGQNGAAATRIVVVASMNNKKAAEFLRMAREVGLDMAFETLGRLSQRVILPPETGTTFEENAELKARHVAQATGLPAIGDDSGLCVDSLDGAPGLYSARYAGPDADDAARRAKMLRELQGKMIPGERTARFVAAVSLALPDGRVWTRRGTCEGTIATEDMGVGGFGYDPIFLPDEIPGRSFGQVTSEEKDQVSHRAKAFRALLPTLIEQLVPKTP